VAVPADHAGRGEGEEPLLKDLSWREIAVFAPLIVWAFWIGLNPQPYFRVLDRPVAQIVERVHPGYYADSLLFTGPSACQKEVDLHRLVAGTRPRAGNPLRRHQRTRRAWRRMF
jgi:hypothetical protein